VLANRGVLDKGSSNSGVLTKLVSASSFLLGFGWGGGESPDSRESDQTLQQYSSSLGETINSLNQICHVFLEAYLLSQCVNKIG
jgi:hypothetical protein